MRLRLVAAASALAAALVAVAPASAFLIQEKAGPQSATHGIVLGPDGNFWVVEEFSGSVVRMSPAGEVLGRYPVGSGPTSATTGPGGRVWIAVTGADKLVWIDATAAVPSTHDVPTGAACGPVGLVAGNNGRIYFSLPSDGVCNAGASMLGSVADDGTGVVTTAAAGGGTVFDLEVTAGKLFAPDFGGDVVRRLALGSLAVESTVSASPGSGPQGVAADGNGDIWFTEWTTGRIAHFPATQNGGVAIELAPSGGVLTNPFGIVAGADGRIYVAGKSSANIARVSADGSAFTFYSAPGAEPFSIINGPDGDLWFTDQAMTRILRLLNTPPRVVMGEAQATGPSSANLTASVNPRGNETQVFFDYGPTTAYGSTSAPVPVANGADPVDVPTVLTELAPSTEYHVRVRAVNAEGSATGDDATFTTPASPSVAPDLVDFTNSPKKLRVSKAGRFTYAFEATPGRSGEAKLKATKSIKVGSRKRKLKLRPEAFTAPANGEVELKFKLSRKDLDALKTVRNVPFGVKVTLGATTFPTELKLKPPKSG